jgi:hypothetical protein
MAWWAVERIERKSNKTGKYVGKRRRLNVGEQCRSRDVKGRQLRTRKGQMKWLLGIRKSKISKDVGAVDSYML